MEQQVRLAADGAVNSAGEFEILAITAGEGNGWQFEEGVLRASLAQWEGAACFVDHAWRSHSLRDLGGLLHSVEWDAARQGVKARLRPLGPSGALVAELGRQLVSAAHSQEAGGGDAAGGEGTAGGAPALGAPTNMGMQPRVGFSADVVFTAQGRRVEQILRVLSVDLVFNPARGGAFLRALNSLEAQGVWTMDDVHETETRRAPLGAGQGEPAGQPVIGQPPAGDPGLRGQLSRALVEAQQVRAELCAAWLETALAGARLPQPAAEQVRRQLGGKVFDAGQLAQAIDDARGLVAALTAGGLVQGPGRISAMFSSEDQLQAAVDDLLGAQRDPDKQALKTARLSGVRELYLMLTGDNDLHGGYYPQQARLATTADFSGLVKNSLNKVVAQQWAELGRAGYEWWRAVVQVEHCTSLNDITGILVGTVGDLPSVAEGAEYTELAVGDSPETGSFTKYGGYIPLTLELIDRDETRKLRQYPRQLATAGLRKLSSLVAGIFTANSGVGPTLADTGALFNATAVTTKGGHANLLTTALSGAQWDVVQTAVYNQPMLTKADSGFYGVGPKMAINPRYCLVPRQLELTARKILYPGWENAANIHSENQQRGSLGDVLVVPDWTDATDWAAACDPAVAPAIIVGERFGLLPEVYIAGGELSPAVFTNDEQRLKVRHFLSVFVADYRPLHKSNVAG